MSPVFQLKPLPRTLSAAISDLTHPREHVRSSALKDLVRLAAGETRAEAIEAIAQVLEKEELAELRAEAALALADAGAGMQLPALLRAANDAHARVRQMVLIALGELSPRGHKQSSEVIGAALSARLPALRFQALLAAHKVMSEQLPGQLQLAMRDEDAKIRYLSLRLADADQVLDPEHMNDSKLRQGLKRAAERLLSDADRIVRTGAAMLLAPFGHTAAHELIAEALNSGIKLPEAEDEQHLIELAGELRIASSLRGLKRHAVGRMGLLPGRFAWQAKVALAQLGDADTQAAMLRSLKSWNRDARTLAVVACGRAALVSARPLLEAMRGQDSVDEAVLEDALRQLTQS